MLSELRTIHFSTDLIFPPLDHSTEERKQQHRDRIKEVYDKVRSEKGIDFNKMDVDSPNGPHLWTRSPSGHVTSYSFLGDRVRAQDEWTERTLDDFSKDVISVMDVCFRVFRIPIIVLQFCVVRAVAKPHPHEDAREFLFGHGLGLSDEKMGLFGRPAHVAGINIVFPPVKEARNEQRVRIESYAKDSSQLFLEVCSTFQGSPIPATQLNTIGENLRASYSFLDEQVCAFINALISQKGEEKQ